LTVRGKTEEFIELHGGKVIDEIPGQAGTIGYKVLIDNRMFHVYYSREWYRKYNGISIPRGALAIGVGENATIVMYIINECFWQYASEWLAKGTHLENTMYGTAEVLIKKEDLLTGSFNQNLENLNPPEKEQTTTMEEFFHD